MSIKILQQTFLLASWMFMYIRIRQIVEESRREDIYIFSGDRQCVIKYFVKPSQQWLLAWKKGSEMLNDSLVCITIQETRLHIISISAGKLLFNDPLLIVKKERAIKKGRWGGDIHKFHIKNNFSHRMK